LHRSRRRSSARPVSTYATFDATALITVSGVNVSVEVLVARRRRPGAARVGATQTIEKPR